MAPKKTSAGSARNSDIQKASGNMSWMGILGTIVVITVAVIYANYDSVLGGKGRFARSPLVKRGVPPPAASTAQVRCDLCAFVCMIGLT